MIYNYLHRDIAEFLYLSFKFDPFFCEIERSISSNPDKNQEGMLKYFDYSMREGQKYGELYFPKKQTYGASIWTKPTNDTLAKKISDEKKEFMLQQLGNDALHKYISIVKFMSEKVKQIVPPESWYLSIVGVSPQMQGKGIGSKLINPILIKADEANVPTYLETYTPRNIKFYKKLGYKELVSFIEPVTACKYWIMIRYPVTDLDHK